MLTDDRDIAFKRRLAGTLNQLEGNWKYKEAAALVKPILAEYEASSWYLLDSDIMAELAIISEKHIYISGPRKLSPIETKDYLVTFLMQPNLISKDVIPYLQITDMVLLFQRQPEPLFRITLEKFKTLVNRLTYEEKKLIIQLTRKYPVFVRAFLGLVLAEINQPLLSAKVLQTLSPHTLNRYKQKVYNSFC
ncbi:hypothetical protein ACLOAU_22875 [Niabella sp. CJ426]|uniref:hypothetical protein n=1 Tax=Niabella sp. CJ426 TaxID=3393740 RepID=UPI003D031FCF